MNSSKYTRFSITHRPSSAANRLGSKTLIMAVVATSLLLLAGLNRTLRADNEESSEETTTVVVVVKEYDTGAPVSQARITLQFHRPGGASRFGKSKQLAFSSKTDAQGRCRLPDVNKGPIVLTITADRHQSYGKKLLLEKDNQVFEIRLKKPQPLL